MSRQVNAFAFWMFRWRNNNVWFVQIKSFFLVRVFVELSTGACLRVFPHYEIILPLCCYEEGSAPFCSYAVREDACMIDSAGYSRKVHLQTDWTWLSASAITMTHSAAWHDFQTEHYSSDHCTALSESCQLTLLQSKFTGACSSFPSLRACLLRFGFIEHAYRDSVLLIMLTEAWLYGTCLLRLSFIEHAYWG